MSNDPIKVTLVNDYEIVVKGLQVMLQPFADRVEVVELEAGGLPDESTDIALFDTFAGRRQSLLRIADMAEDAEIGKVVLYTWDAPLQFVEDARDLDGIVLKTETGVALVEALERIHQGEALGISEKGAATAPTALTEREREVLALVAQGHSNRDIAHELYLAIDTVKTHVRKLFSKLEVSNRTQAALMAEQFDLAPPPRRS